TLTMIGYGLAGAGFALLAILLVTRWRNRMRGSLLLLAVVLTVGWAGTMAATEVGETTFITLCVELAKELAWIVFVVRALAGTGERHLPRTLRFGPPLVAMLALAVGGWAAATGVPLLRPLTLERTYVLAALALAIFGIALVEQAIRNTRASQTWAVKFLWLGAGA